jgi:ComEC/Rec2-related protein
MKNTVETIRLITHLGLETLYRIQKGLSALMLVGVLGFMWGVQSQMNPLELNPWLLKGACLFVLLSVGFWQKFPLWMKRLGLGVLVAFLGFILALIRFQPVHVPDYLDAQYLRLPGKILPHEKGMLLETPHLDTPTPVRILLKTRHNTPLSLGKLTCVSGYFQIGHRPRFLGDFNESHYLQSMGIAGTLTQAFVDHDCLERLPLDASDKPPSWLERQKARFESLILDKRNGYVALLEKTLGTDAGRLMGGIVLGDRASPLPSKLKQAFINTGQIHLVAASGMNVAIIAAGLLFLLRLIPRFPRGGAFAITSLGVLAYGVATGFPPSILRAVVMWFFGLWIKYLFKPLSPLFLLMLAISVLSLMQPYLWLNLGFQLSVLTTFGIVTLFTSIEAILKQKGWNPKRNLIAGLLSAGCLTAVAQLYATPLILHVFHKTPLHAVLMNLLSGILVAPLTLWGFASFGIYALSPTLASFCLLPSQFLLNAQIAWTLWGASLPHLQFAVPTLPTAWMLIAYGVLLSLPWLGWGPSFWKQHPRLKVASFTSVALMSLALIAYPLYWDATRFDRFPQEAWVSLPIGKTFRHDGVKLLHYKEKKQVHSILFVEAPLSSFELGDVARYMDAQHLNPPEEVVFLDASTLKAMQKKSEKKKKRKRRKKAKQKARLTDAQKQLNRVQKTVQTLAKGDVTELLKEGNTVVNQHKKDVLASEEAVYIAAFFEDASQYLKPPKSLAKAQKLFTMDPFEEVSLPMQTLQEMKKEAKENKDKTKEAKDLVLQSKTKKLKKLKDKNKENKETKYLVLKTKEAKHKKLKKLKKLNIKTKETKKRYEESLRRFESDLHQQWASVRLTTLNQHTASLLKWQALNATSYELTLARLDFRLQGHWQAYPTAKSVRYRLVWERFL